MRAVFCFVAAALVLALSVNIVHAAQCGPGDGASLAIESSTDLNNYFLVDNAGCDEFLGSLQIISASGNDFPSLGAALGEIKSISGDFELVSRLGCERL